MLDLRWGTDMNNQEAYERARKRVTARVGFFLHLSAYVVVSMLLIGINVRAPAEYLWFKWPVIGWGIGILFHALTTFVFSEESSLTERLIKKEMGKRTLGGPRPHGGGD